MKKTHSSNLVEPLSKCSVGSKVEILELLANGPLRRRMLDLGIVPRTLIYVVRKSPLGDPIAYNIRGGMIALRKEESDLVLVRKLD